jgi:hypothetical protein
MKALRRRRYSSTLSLTLELDWSGSSTPLHGRLISGTHHKRGWAAAVAGMDGYGESFPTPGFDPGTVQPVQGGYTQQQPAFQFTTYQQYNHFCTVLRYYDFVIYRQTHKHGLSKPST